MVNEISNRTLAILLIAAIVISLGGTLVSLNRISKISIPGVTGFVVNVSNATARVVVSDVTWVNFSNATIDFGTGYVSGGVNCTMNSSNNEKSDSCADFSGSDQTLILANIGNNDVYVNLSFGKNASTLLGGTQEGYGRDYRFIVGNDTTAPGCANTTYYLTWTTVPPGDENASLPAVLICDNLTYTDGSNKININISLTIPQDASTGTLSDEITATVETI
jgi:hypothetical protein